MTSGRVLLLTLLPFGAVPGIQAQAAPGVAITPMVGVGVNVTMAQEDGAYEFTANSKASFGVELELPVGRRWGVGLGGSYGFGQTLTILDGAGAEFGSANISSPTLYALASFRPGGRSPGGRIRPLAIQAGAGVILWNFDRFQADLDGDGSQETPIAPDAWSATEPFVFTGLAVNFAFGPRATVQFLARVVGTFGYDSDGLGEFNTTNGGSAAGGFAVTPLFGFGIRIGR